jgi:hypothetical protein
MEQPLLGATSSGADRRTEPPLSPSEEEALKILRELAREQEHQPDRKPLRPDSGNRYVQRD